MKISNNDIKYLCEKLGMSQQELHDRVFAYKTHVDPETAVGYTVDYLGSLMINQTLEEQNKMLIYLISQCAEMLL